MMKQLVQTQIFSILGAIWLLTPSVATSQSLVHPKRNNMNQLSQRLEQAFAKTKSLCFGRFVIDVPETAVVVFGRMTVDFEVSHLSGEADAADKHIAKQVLKLEKDDFLYKNMNTPGSLYGKVVNEGVAGQKTFIGAGGNSYRISSYVPIGGDLFIFETNGISNTKKVKQDIAEIGLIARRLRARTEKELPSEPGICLEGGFVNFSPTFENIEMGIRLAELPDVHLSIGTIKNRGSVDEDEKLENRLHAAERDAIQEGKGELFKRIKFLRRAPRQMGDWVGEEVLARMPAEKGTFESHKFQFYAVGEADDILRPVADVQLQTGVVGNATRAKPPSVSDEEAVAIWDRLTSSIRARPTTPVTTAKK
jgi:hypothetical protein